MYSRDRKDEKRLYTSLFDELWWPMADQWVHRWPVQDLSVCDMDWHLPRHGRELHNSLVTQSCQGFTARLHSYFCMHNPRVGRGHGADRTRSQTGQDHRQDKLLQSILQSRDSVLNSCQLSAVEIKLEPKMNQIPKLFGVFLWKK